MTRFMLALIRMATPRADREFVVGDTLEELAHIGRTESPAAARRWLRGELWRVLMAAPQHRLTARRQARHVVRHAAGPQMEDGYIRNSFRSMALASDVRDAWRGLRAGRGTTALAFAILTIVIAAGTITFSIVDAVALRPLPFASPESLVAITRISRAGGAPGPAAPQDYFSWAEGVTALESIGASRGGAPLRLQDDDGEAVPTAAVTANLFDVLGVGAFAGRLIGPDHARAGQDAVVVLSHALWTRHFNSDPGVIGRPVTLLDWRGAPATREVIGVLPRGVIFPMAAGMPDPGLFIPYVPTEADRSHASPGRTYAMWVVGRLAPGATIDQARADIERVSASFGTTPADIRVMPLHERVVGPAGSWLLFALAAVGVVLLIACVNVASLLLARASVRVRELATREALGASRARLARGFLLEGLMLSLTAALVAVALSFRGVEIARTLLPENLARTSTIAVDARVLIVSIAVSALCGLVFAMAPAWLASRSNLIAVTKAGGGAVIGGRRSSRTLGGFLVAELAFVSLLLVATTLIVTSFVVVTTMDLGFDRRNVMSIGYSKSLQAVAEADRPAAAAVLRDDLLARVRAVPGVESAALLINAAPLSGSSVRYSIEVPGFGQTMGDDMLETRMISPGYVETMGQQLISGRTFNESDRAGAPLVALINEAAAQRFFGGRDPVGEVITFRGPTTIVGVLRSVRFQGPEADVRPELYTPVDQERIPGAQTFGSLVVRTAGPAPLVATAVRDAIRPLLDGADPAQAQFIDEQFQRLTAGRRFNASVMTFFGLVAVAIGAVGIYGTMAFFVAQQVRAIGLRMALGATPSRVMRAVLRDAAWRVLAGVAIGLAGAWAISNAFASFVYGVTTTEPRVYVMVAGLIAAVSLAAAVAPALRAARVDPLVALRTE